MWETLYFWWSLSYWLYPLLQLYVWVLGSYSLPVSLNYFSFAIILASANNLCYKLATLVGFSKSDKLPVSNPSRMLFWRIRDKHPSTFLRSPSNIVICFLSVNYVLVALYICFDDKVVQVNNSNFILLQVLVGLTYISWSVLLI